MNKGKLPLSVVIITHNEEEIIGRTLEAIKDLASEIIVVDSHSTDKTIDIAKSFGARVFIEKWKGYSEQKNFALERCSQEWILFLDADEIPSQELKNSIKEALANPSADAYMINRKTYFLGKFLEHTWQPDWKLRLVRRKANPKWFGEVHEILKVEGNVKKLNGVLLHYSYKDLKHLVLKGLHFAQISAEIKYSKGKRIRIFKDLILRPIWTFIKEFFIRGGVLDGYRGFIIAVTSSFYTFIKYSFLMEMYLKDLYGEELWKKGKK